MKCETVRELPVAYHKGELDDDKRAAVEEHLAQCTACAAEAEGARRIVATLDQASDEPIERIASTVIEHAVKRRATDIHIRPASDHLMVRYRIDGVLHDAIRLPAYVIKPLAARIKHMANLSVSERNIAQDGRIRVEHEGKEYDLRVSVLPSASGESVVMRVLDPSAVQLGLGDIGMHPSTRERFDELLRRPNGLVLVAGPTGGGKTTTLYAALKSLMKPEIAVFSIEDPVEYRFDGVTQIPINPRAGVTFAVAMRHLLRRDPDVILCAEIRDRETLQLCLSAALTGHLLLTTLHTDDAIRTVRRMIDVGAERFLVADTLLGVLAQRLVRKTHRECAEQHAVTEEQRQWLPRLPGHRPPRAHGHPRAASDRRGTAADDRRRRGDWRDRARGRGQARADALRRRAQGRRGRGGHRGGHTRDGLHAGVRVEGGNGRAEASSRASTRHGYSSPDSIPRSISAAVLPAQPSGSSSFAVSHSPRAAARLPPR